MTKLKRKPVRPCKPREPCSTTLHYEDGLTFVEHASLEILGHLLQGPFRNMEFPARDVCNKAVRMARILATVIEDAN